MTHQIWGGAGEIWYKQVHQLNRELRKCRTKRKSNVRLNIIDQEHRGQHYDHLIVESASSSRAQRLYCTEYLAGILPGLPLDTNQNTWS